ncbi:MAG: hypothetical protein JXP72_04145 [Coriobacteriia bacterium]|nr:hypothetical protein [Coriobacteriia bacterium]
MTTTFSPVHSVRFVSLSLLVMLFAALVATPAAATVTDVDGMTLTSDAFEQTRPEVWNGTVVWEDSRNGNKDIYAWSAERGVFAACTNASSQTLPDVGDDYIVWQDRRNGNDDIYAYNLVTRTEVPICIEVHDQNAPAIFQRYIVWQDYRNGNADIYGYDLVTDTEFPVCVATGEQEMPAIWGDYIVWLDYRTLPGGAI